MQPFCAAELCQVNHDISLDKEKDALAIGQNRLAPDQKGDVALGFEQGFIKIYNFSHHF